jgi:hypothetical protein
LRYNISEIATGKVFQTTFCLASEDDLSAPHNRDENKKYAGVGGHLFAIAIKLSIANGFDGYICFEAKNLELVEHYAIMLGVTMLPRRGRRSRRRVYGKANASTGN